MHSRHLRTVITSAAAVLAVAATSTAVVLSASGAPAPAAFPSGFKSVGYATNHGSATAIQYSKLTHVMYSFARPNADGSLKPIENTAKLKQVVQLGHQNNVKVLIAVGGWNNGDDSPFETLAASAAGRAKLVAALSGVVSQYGLDGVDMDWEYPDPGASANNFTLLMKELSAAMKGKGKLLTAAVSAKNMGAGVQPAVFGYVDFLNIMTYDGGTPHANYDWAIDAMKYWLGRGLPKEKAVMGVPFYSRPGNRSFADIVALNPANANKDCVVIGGVNECYNGLPTIRSKTKWALANAGGMMNWQLAQDATGASSALTAIWETASTGQQPGGGMRLVSQATNRCLTVEGATPGAGSRAVVFDCNGGANQNWTLTAAGELRVYSGSSERCLDVRGGGSVLGAQLQIWPCTGNANQRFTAADKGWIRGQESGRCLDVKGGGNSPNNTPVVLWDCSQTASHQKWSQSKAG
jgi:chitinase